ncbi:YihY/virulence factor BrkB family protein [Microbacterium sp. P04]|uniref:YihY/virulence factor BrkB family protein n=1 Tax=Microbacterium sp. P04 TaxID=3366947 RepID=UPI003744FCE3
MADPNDPSERRAALRERLDEPIERATRITRKTLASFPVRVWRHFLQHNGFLLAAGISYQSLFAILGVIYLAFAVAGLWLGGSDGGIQGLISLINRYIPEIISENGLVKPEQVQAVADGSSGLLTVTGVIAGLVVIWTATGFITYARRAVRDTFGLPFDRRSYVVLKARDFVAAALFGVALLVGAALGAVATGALELLFTFFGWSAQTIWSRSLARLLSLVVAFALNTFALAGMFRFLTGASLSWRRIWSGSLLGGGAMVVLQVAAGFLFVYTPANPLLATFAIFIGFLLWFRLNGIVILVAAAWIAVAAGDRGMSLLSPAERRSAEHAALVTAAEVRLREAEDDAAEAPWYERRRAARHMRRARQELEEIKAAAPPQPGLSLLD